MTYMQRNPPPRGMPKREVRALIEELKELLDVAEMKSANFDSPFDSPLTNSVPIDPQRPTEFIRDRTRIWRQSWLIRPLQALIDRYEATLPPTMRKQSERV